LEREASAAGSHTIVATPTHEGKQEGTLAFLVQQLWVVEAVPVRTITTWLPHWVALPQEVGLLDETETLLREPPGKVFVVARQGVRGMQEEEAGLALSALTVEGALVPSVEMAYQAQF